MLQLFAMWKLINATQLYEAVAMSLYDIIILMFHQVVASKQRGMDGEYSELLMLSCSQSSIKLGKTGL